MVVNHTGPRVSGAAAIGVDASGDHTEKKRGQDELCNKAAATLPGVQFCRSRAAGEDRTAHSAALGGLPDWRLPELGEDRYGIAVSNSSGVPSPTNSFARPVGTEKRTDLRLPPGISAPAPRSATAPDKGRRWGRHWRNAAPAPALLLPFYPSHSSLGDPVEWITSLSGS